MAEVPLPREARRPSLTVSQITFSGGESFNLGPTDAVVFVGPNNSGKSAALRQIEVSLAKPGRYQVVDSIRVDKAGDAESFSDYVKSKGQFVTEYGTPHYVGYKYKIRASELAEIYNRPPSDDVRDFFVLRCSTDDRLSGSNPVKSIAYRREQPTHPIHLLVMDRELESKIGDSFSRAFGQHLFVNRAGGSDVTLYVSDNRASGLPNDAFSDESIRFFEEKANPLHRQGDGMRAFATMALNTMGLSQQTVLLIDEPEAFLHPPQARLLGRVITSHDADLRQTFIATHSADILKGILEASDRAVHVLRITRRGDINNVYRLDPDLAKEISGDPLVRFSGVFEGIFFKHIVFCEADTDCQFYGTLLDIPEVSGEVRPDVLFVQGSGKHRIVRLARIAKQLGVPFSAVLDVDVLNEKTLFKNLADAFGIGWNTIESSWRDVTNAINSQKARLSLSQMVAAVEEAVEKLRSNEISLGDFLEAIKSTVRANSPWEMVKRGGRSALPMGDTVEKFDRLLELCAEHGLWIVPVGELEGFCRSIGGSKGSAWMAKLMETHDLAVSAELHDAREFVRHVWERAAAVSG